MLQFLSPLASLATSFMENKIEQTKAKGAVAKAEAEAKASVMKTAAEHDTSSGNLSWPKVHKKLI